MQLKKLQKEYYWDSISTTRHTPCISVDRDKLSKKQDEEKFVLPCLCITKITMSCKKTVELKVNINEQPLIKHKRLTKG